MHRRLPDLSNVQRDVIMDAMQADGAGPSWNVESCPLGGHGVHAKVRQQKAVAVFDSGIARVPKDICSPPSSLQVPEPSLGELCQRAKSALQSAAIDGRLTDIILQMAPPARSSEPSDMESLHWKTNDSISCRLDSSLESLRLQVKEVLFSAAVDGRLARRLARPCAGTTRAPPQDMQVESAAGNAAHSGPSVVQVPRLETIRHHTRQALLGAALDGRLSSELSGLRQHKPKASNECQANENEDGLQVAKPPLEYLRTKSQHAIFGGALDGRLLKAVLEVKQVQASRRTACTCRSVQEKLSQAALNGRLASVLKEVQHQGYPTKALQHSLHDSRQQAWQSLSRAALDGRLCEVLAEVQRQRSQVALERTLCKARAPPLRVAVDGHKAGAVVDAQRHRGPHHSMQELLMGARQRLSSAAIDGRLKEALGDVQSEKRKPTLDDLRSLARHVFTKAALDGRFADAMKQIPNHQAALRLTQNPPEAEHLSEERSAAMHSNLEDALERTRYQAREALMKAERDGSLRALLQKVPNFSTSATLPQPSVQGLRLQALQIFSGAALNGSLSAAIAGVQEQKLLVASDPNSSQASEALMSSPQRSCRMAEQCLGNRRPVAGARQQQQQQLKTLAAFRQQLRKDLAVAAIDGRLTGALAVTKQQRQAVSLMSLRSRVQETLLEGSRNGSLATALAQRMPVAAAQAQTELPVAEPKEAVVTPALAYVPHKPTKAKGTTRPISGTLREAGNSAAPGGTGSLSEQLQAPRPMQAPVGAHSSVVRSSKSQRVASRQCRRIIGGIAGELRPTSGPEPSVQCSPDVSTGRRAKVAQVVRLDLGEVTDGDDSADAVEQNAAVQGNETHHLRDSEEHAQCVAQRSLTESPVARALRARVPTPRVPTPSSSRQRARHRVALAASSAMALDLEGPTAQAHCSPAAVGGDCVAIASTMALGLGEGMLGSMRWRTMGRAATPLAQQRQASHSLGALRLHKPAAPREHSLPAGHSKVSGIALPALPALSCKQFSSESIAWSMQLEKSTTRWNSTQAIL